MPEEREIKLARCEECGEVRINATDYSVCHTGNCGRLHAKIGVGKNRIALAMATNRLGEFHSMLPVTTGFTGVQRQLFTIIKREGLYRRVPAKDHRKTDIPVWLPVAAKRVRNIYLRKWNDTEG